jgi:hypothetical protein
MSQIARFWLALDRGYLPIKVAAFRPVWSEKLPVGSRRVGELKELAPGIWLRWRVREIFYSGPAAKEGKSVVTQQVDTVVTSATLNPNYGIDFFRDVSVAERLHPAR